MIEKKLYRSKDRRLCGVCGGLAEYLGVDPTLVRLVFAILTMTTGVGIFPYFIAALIMEEEPTNDTKSERLEEKQYSAQNSSESDEVIGFKPATETNEVKGFEINEVLRTMK